MVTMDKPYDLNRPSDEIAREVVSRIRRREEMSGEWIDLGTLAEVEALLEQYNAEFTKLYDLRGTDAIVYQKRIKAMAELLRLGVALVESMGSLLLSKSTEEKRQRWLHRVHDVLMDVIVEEIEKGGGDGQR